MRNLSAKKMFDLETFLLHITSKYEEDNKTTCKKRVKKLKK